MAQSIVFIQTRNTAGTSMMALYPTAKRPLKSGLWALARLSCVTMIMISMGLGCAAVSTTTKTADSFNKVTPAWVRQHPASATAFIGIGCAAIDGNRFEAHQKARNLALSDIANQISITVNSRTRLATNSNDFSSDATTLCEDIVTNSDVALQQWQEVAAYTDSDGFVWSMIELNKQRFFDSRKLNFTPITNAITDIIASCAHLSAADRIAHLYRGLCMLDTLSIETRRGDVDGKTLLLANELHRVMANTLENIAIQAVTVTQSISTPDTLSVAVSCFGKPDTSLDLTWISSHPALSLKPRPDRNGMQYRCAIVQTALSKKPVTILVMPRLGHQGYDLIRRNFSLPTASIIIEQPVEAASVIEE
ncbi:MAG: LPP20 family lipoprotein [Chitinivibrionales bacterium]|nr:LPP20 family lipoprotein [Chitinivibrionales bacterium]